MTTYIVDRITVYFTFILMLLLYDFIGNNLNLNRHCNMLTRTASTILARRTSSLTLRVRGRYSTDAQPKNYIGPRLPYEIIETVVGFVLPAYPCSESRFFALHSLIRASKMLREISLRLYFRNIVVDNWELFTKVWDYLSIQNEIFGGSNSFSWVR